MPLSAEQVTLYEAVVRETMEAIEAAEGIQRAGLVFKLLTALKQICNHPAQYLKQNAPLPGRSGKLAAFDELLDVILAGGESMLVFTQYTQMATLLQQRFTSIVSSQGQRKARLAAAGSHKSPAAQSVRRPGHKSHPRCGSC